MTKSKIIYLLVGISVFVISMGLSYLIFTFRSPTGPITPKPRPTASTTPGPVIKPKKPTIDPSVPRTAVCPLTGALFTEADKAAWATRRPLGVMIENSQDARPQSGLSLADVVYEAVVEGGITRFMGMFYCNAALAGNVMLAPVRSARIHFVNLITEYDGLYNHVGGAGTCNDPNVDPRAKAICAIGRYGIKDLDQFREDGAGAFRVCHRVTDRLDKEVAAEHTMACFLEELYSAAAKQGWTNVDKKKISWDKNFTPWKFKSTPTKTTGDPATSISYFFWGSNRGVGSDFNQDFDVSWTYDPALNAYARSNGGVASLDHNSDEPLVFTNVVVQFTKEIPTGDLEKHIVYEVIGSGKALIFQDGVATPATWSKASSKARTIYKDLKGAVIAFTPGPIWVSILPLGNDVTYR